MVFSGDEPLPPYTPKALDKEARGITIVKTTPYNCKLLGETEGRDSAEGESGARPTLMKEGAMNDLRNEARYVVGDGKRAILSVTKESMKCRDTKKNLIYDCTNSQVIKNLIYYEVQAQIFDCSDRQ